MKKRERKEEAERIFAMIVNEALEEYVIVNEIKSLADFKAGKLREMLTKFYSRMHNETLRTKINIQLEYIERYIDYSRIDYDLCVKNFYDRKMREVMLYATYIKDYPEKNAFGCELYFTPSSTVLVESVLPLFRKWIKEHGQELMGKDLDSGIYKLLVKGFYNTVNYYATQKPDGLYKEAVLSEFVGLIGFKFYS